MSTSGGGEPQRRLTPEEKELAIKKVRLDELQAQLVERELELETLRGGMLQFEKNYQAATIERYAQLDELRARVAELQSRRKPEGVRRHGRERLQPVVERDRTMWGSYAHETIVAAPSDTRLR